MFSLRPWARKEAVGDETERRTFLQVGEVHDLGFIGDI